MKQSGEFYRLKKPIDAMSKVTYYSDSIWGFMMVAKTPFDNIEYYIMSPVEVFNPNDLSGMNMTYNTLDSKAVTLSEFDDYFEKLTDEEMQRHYSPYKKYIITNGTQYLLFVSSSFTINENTKISYVLVDDKSKATQFDEYNYATVFFSKSITKGLMIVSYFNEDIEKDPTSYKPIVIDDIPDEITPANYESSSIPADHMNDFSISAIHMNDYVVEDYYQSLIDSFIEKHDHTINN